MKFTTEKYKEWLLVAEDSHFTKWVKECGDLCHNIGHNALIERYVNEGDVCVDIGANIGTVTLAMLRRGAVVHAFEPHPVSYACLVHNCAVHIGAKFKTYKKALGNECCKIKIDTHGCENNIGMAYVSKGKPNGEMITLDSLGLKNVKYIKIDAEGFEPQILMGAIDTISESKPIIDIEVNDYTLQRYNQTPEAIYAILREMGYTWQTWAGETPQLDILCIPV